MTTPFKSLTALAVGLLVPASSAADVLYVDIGAAGANDGTSWADAFHSLQDALAVAQVGDEVWVAAGTYKPTAGADRHATFQLISDVSIYGGFSGNETVREQRDWTYHATVLSGDIGSEGDHSDNSTNVVTGSGVDASAVLDGFSIRYGYGDDGGSEYRDIMGAGLFNDSGHPTLRNVAFEHNYAPFAGGGIGNRSSNPTIENATFLDNSAHWSSGYGGGIFNEDGSSPTLRNVEFVGNYSWNGGGMYSGLGCEPTIVNGLFHWNWADGRGGAVAAFEAESMTCINVTMVNNLAYHEGGAIFTRRCDMTLTNCIIWGNEGNLELEPTPVLTLSDEILGDGNVTVAHSIFRLSGGSGGSWNADLGIDGGGNLDVDPVFVNADVEWLAMGDYHLLPASPAINAGESSAIPAGLLSDLDGNDRIRGPAVDMGAYEYQGVVPTRLRSLAELKALFEARGQP